MIFSLQNLNRLLSCLFDILFRHRTKVQTNVLETSVAHVAENGTLHIRGPTLDKVVKAVRAMYTRIDRRDWSEALEMEKDQNIVKICVANVKNWEGIVVTYLQEPKMTIKTMIMTILIMTVSSVD